MEIDLGRDCPSPICQPAAEPDVASEKVYPSLYIDSEGDELDELPSSGTMLVKYKVRERVQRDSSGKRSSSVVLEIKKILEATAAPTPREKRGAELDKYAEEEAQED